MVTMKLKFKCRLIMTDEIRDDEVEEVLSTEEIAEHLIADLKIGLTKNGHVLIEDASMETEKDGDHM